MLEKGLRELNKCMKKFVKRDMIDLCIVLNMFRYGLMKFIRFVFYKKKKKNKFYVILYFKKNKK